MSLKTEDDYFYYSAYKMNQGDYEAAAKLLDKARDLAPKDGRAFCLSADLACVMGQTEDCLEYLKKAVHLDKLYQDFACQKPRVDVHESHESPSLAASMTRGGIRTVYGRFRSFCLSVNAG